MIYDCFSFFNELDLLEIRLQELDSVVDRFVLVESTHTFQKTEKPLYYLENKERFKKFENKIEHIVVDKFPGFFYKFRVPKAWDYSNYQKNQIARGLKNCEPDDLVIISDLDEIPRSDRIREYKDAPGVKVFQQKYYNYYLNCVTVDTENEPCLVKRNGVVFWRGSVMLKYRDFTDFKKTRLLRDTFGDDIIQIEDGGWHFSFMGGQDIIEKKLRAWEHSKESKYFPEHLKNPKNIKEIINSGADLFGRGYQYAFVNSDADLPDFVVKNRHKYTHLFREIDELKK